MSIDIWPDAVLLQFYMQGFNDELEGKSSSVLHEPIYQIAYNMGTADAIVGDDVPSNDLQTDEEILKRIRK